MHLPSTYKTKPAGCSGPNPTALEHGIESLTLVLLNFFEGEAVCGTNLPKVWQLVGKPEAFRAYVYEGVVHHLKQTKEVAEKERDKLKESKK